MTGQVPAISFWGDAQVGKERPKKREGVKGGATDKGPAKQEERWGSEE